MVKEVGAKKAQMSASEAASCKDLKSMFETIG